MKRCDWVDLNNPLYVEYHDKEWGVPVHDDRHLFEMLILEGAQAGLSWSTVLNKRAHYKTVFDNFDFNRIAKYDSSKINRLVSDAGIIRNKLKINSAVKNAKVFIAIREEFGTFDKYLLQFVNFKQIKNKVKKYNDIPTSTDISDKISKDLKKRGMSFVGSTIIYAFMQAIGMVDDHEVGCFKYKKV